MEDTIIQFEIAKLAKEKGFNYKVRQHYRDGNNYNQELIFGGSLYDMNSLEEQKLWNTNLYSAPTQSLLQRWLREVHNIDITVALVGNGYGFYIHKNRNYTNNGENYGVSGYTYELTLEAALKEALKLI